ncbi:MAG TPA: FAD-dependent oxidoreductase [Rectinemataceae bacterium]
MKTEFDCVIVGGGPAGMAAAVELASRGVSDILLVDRNPALGGILNQCIHPGFGLERYGRDLTGPECAAAMVEEFGASGATALLGSMVLGISADRIVSLISPEAGYLRIRAKAVLVATGCRERTRENLEVGGTRPTGVFTAGQAQNLVNLRGYRIGERVVVQGSGDIGLIMARRMSILGARVECVLERLPYLSGLLRNKVQCLDHFGIPLRFHTQIREIRGYPRVEGVVVEEVDACFKPIPGSEAFISCDTVLFSVGLIPEVDILKEAGLSPPLGGSVLVNSAFETSRRGIFVCGNALHIHDLADNAAKEGALAARAAAAYISSPDSFAESLEDRLPYSPIKPNTRYDEAFFKRLAASKAKVCIVCPKGCMVTEGKGGCPKGPAYYAEAEKGSFQVLTATAWSSAGGKRKRIPLRTEGPVDVRKLESELRALRLSAHA